MTPAELTSEPTKQADRAAAAAARGWDNPYHTPDDTAEYVRAVLKELAREFKGPSAPRKLTMREGDMHMLHSMLSDLGKYYAAWDGEDRHTAHVLLAAAQAVETLTGKELLDTLHRIASS